jgi:hypothetical protein
VALTFTEIDFRPLQGRAGRPDLGWTRLELKFDDGTGHCPSVGIVLCQKTGPDTTISELERGATGHAKTILREALRLLEAQDVTSLVAGQDSRDEASRQELAALQEPLNL